MRLSQFGTKLFAVTAASFISLNSFAVGNLNSTSDDFHSRLKELMDAKKRPELSISTDSQRLPFNRKGHILKKDQQIEVQKMGGVSDGGGNAVGATLFDFYENEGSNEITIDQLLYLEPQANNILKFLNSEVPAVRNVDSGGFGDLLKNAVKGKHIFLEAKAISSEACKNQSMVASDQQTVVACQSDSEIRFDLNWLKSTDAKNRSGLITHELILGWARGTAGNLDKKEMEEKVRELNRAVFSPRQDENTMPDNIKRLFSENAFNKSRFRIAQGMKIRIGMAMANFCKDATTDINSAFADVWNDEFLMKTVSVLPATIISMRDVSLAARAGNKDAGPAQAKLCELYNLDQSEIRPPRMDVIPQNCIRNLNDAVTLAVQTTAATKEDTAMNSFFKAQSKTILLSSANLCKGLRAIELEKKWFMTNEKATAAMDETYKESINYTRYYLKQNGITIQFHIDE
ncbi:hypothetical protein [Bdellovibrio sp. NC01]|uniref:hypothetical protein n=1 Tax=Bdellovibrio sp. NC01 TaxID=2220073 RepID=UPI001156EDDB|nr:hypothetical protein [Bdellovibrio sp. NC01]QDK36117.1 hypothetical protein DOE51_00120 [Bdellovibrio sp. NC01]